MAVISVNYTDGDQSSYKSVEIWDGDDSKVNKSFDSGDFVKDWYDLMKYIINYEPEIFPLVTSSSCFHFIDDGDSYESALLLVDENDNPSLIYEYDERALPYYVRTGDRPNWEEFREMCGDPSKQTRMKFEGNEQE